MNEMQCSLSTKRDRLIPSKVMEYQVSACSGVHKKFYETQMKVPLIFQKGHRKMLELSWSLKSKLTRWGGG